jgi:hypothetical protein
MIPGWKEEFEEEYLQILRQIPKASPGDCAVRLAVSEGSAIYWLTELAKEGKVRILAVELVKEGEATMARPGATSPDPPRGGTP